MRLRLRRMGRGRVGVRVWIWAVPRATSPPLLALLW